jgi:hypothetical protein
MQSALSYGDCLVTISTGAKIDAGGPSRSTDGRRIVGLTAADEEATGLVPSHAYAVLGTYVGEATQIV